MKIIMRACYAIGVILSSFLFACQQNNTIPPVLCNEDGISCFIESIKAKRAVKHVRKVEGRELMGMVHNVTSYQEYFPLSEQEGLRYFTTLQHQINDAPSSKLNLNSTQFEELWWGSNEDMIKILEKGEGGSFSTRDYERMLSFNRQEEAIKDTSQFFLSNLWDEYLDYTEQLTAKKVDQKIEGMVTAEWIATEKENDRLFAPFVIARDERAIELKVNFSKNKVYEIIPEGCSLEIFEDEMGNELLGKAHEVLPFFKKFMARQKWNLIENISLGMDTDQAAILRPKFEWNKYEGFHFPILFKRPPQKLKSIRLKGNIMAKFPEAQSSIVHFSNIDMKKDQSYDLGDSGQQIHFDAYSGFESYSCEWPIQKMVFSKDGDVLDVLFEKNYINEKHRFFPREKENISIEVSYTKPLIINFPFDITLNIQ